MSIECRYLQRLPSSGAQCMHPLIIAKKLSLSICLGVTQLNVQRFVVRRFIAAAHPSKRPMNRATTTEIP